VSGLSITGTAAYIIISDMVISTSGSPGYCIQISGTNSTLICRRINVSGGDRNTAFFRATGAGSTLICDSCIGFYPQRGASRGIRVRPRRADARRRCPRVRRPISA
jgi:hypothetical protein